MCSSFLLAMIEEERKTQSAIKELDPHDFPSTISTTRPQHHRQMDRRRRWWPRRDLRLESGLCASRVRGLGSVSTARFPDPVLRPSVADHPIPRRSLLTCVA
ncbi:stress-responsive transcriptional regulator [Corynebacterium glutamicum R]|uniref:Stress-responsive transcriptional regulator n=1 Tax=Corynebacterium glutamicum (strain R) TaxID=340322 RepID=A0AB72VAB4_CORGB|nr:stress-responsive transcriptional regulator [Corynebacterium glutamicum R]